MAPACRPKLLLADEPTTALEVTVQAQILELLTRLKREFCTAIILITRDLGIIAEFADHALVMYAGRVVERCGTDPLFDAAMHPYTQGLLRSIPAIDEDVARLHAVLGSVPALLAMPKGCRFAPPSSYAQRPCQEVDPLLLTVGALVEAACIRHSGYALPHAEQTR